jgi:peptidoglycan-associated lipoprotein
MTLGFNAMGFLSCLALVVFAGCSTESAKKPETSPSAASSSKAQTGAAKPAPAPRPGGATSSLDAHQERKTPASGPLKDIYFSFDRYDLSPDARSTLKANAEWLRANPGLNIEIEGHCDERGTTDYNLALGAKRARAAMDYLVSLGVSPARIKTTSYGEEVAACKEASESCYQKNRRDRFVDIRPRSAS